MAKIFREGTHPLWAVVVSLYVVAAVAINFYWLFTDSGPVATLNHWQVVGLFTGHYYPNLTFISIFLVELIPLFALKRVLERVIGKPLTR